MVRFKVIRASRLLLIVAIVLLAAVLGLIGVKLFSPKGSAPKGTSANFVETRTNDEAKTAVVFASRVDAETESLPLDPIQPAIEIEILKEAAPAVVEKPSVLIYHTHTHEAYEQVSDDPYEALEAWRTNDADHSVVRVGEELKRQLERLGFEAVHDVTDHEGSELSTAYTRSLVTLERYDRAFDLYIDLHRDAYVDGTEESATLRSGERAAQLMMLIGNGIGFDEKPYYEQNYAFAKALERRINDAEPGLCKPVLVKDGRYNQHIGVFSILVEVGHNRNTLREALNAVPMLAEALRSLMIDSPDARLLQMKADYESRARH